jgi:DNA/RNA-binding domain of Phe-tRNA-synthetase-like protein
VQKLKPDDMLIRDEVGILSSIIYGPDLRTRITPETRAVIFTVYGPPGISADEVDRHLADLEANVRLFSPQAEVEARGVLRAA